MSHSIGVFHTARQLMGIIRASVGQADWSVSKSNAALAAALVHDVGHGPFSHAFEEVGKRLSLKLANHEYVSDQLIRNSDIAGPLQDISSGFHNDVAAVIASKGPRTVYDAVVSSQFDADRLDYIRRDRVMAGSSHGFIDYDWLVSNLGVDSISLGVDDQKVSDLKTFVIGSKGVLAAESYVLGLFQLYPTIYLHKATRGVEKLFTELMVRVFQLVLDGSVDATGLHMGHPLVSFAKDPTSIEGALCLDDSVVFGALSMMVCAKDPIVAEFSTRIRDRKLFRCFDLREAVRRNVHQKIGRASGDALPIAQEIERTVSRITLSVADKIEVWKAGQKNSIVLRDQTSRNPYKRFEESKGPLNQIMVRSASGSLIDLAEFSPVVRAIPTFEVFRYYFSRDLDGVDKQFNELISREISHGV